MKINKRKFLIGVGIFLTLCTVCYVTFRLTANSYLAEARTLMKDAGFPLQVIDVIPKAVKDEDNAAFMYRAAHDVLLGEGWSSIQEVLELSDAEERSVENESLVKTFMDSTGVPLVIPLLEKAATQRSCVFVNDYSAGPMLVMNHINFKINTFLQAAFKHYCHQREWESARGIVRLQAIYARHLSTEPFLISLWVSIAHLNIALDNARLLARQSPETALQLLKLLDGTWIHTAGINAIHGERLIFGEWVFREPPNDKAVQTLESSFQPFPVTLYRSTPFWELDHAALLRQYYQIAKCFESPYEIIDEHFFGEQIASYHIITQMMYPAYRSRIMLLDCMANAEITKAGIQVLAYKQQHGSWPEAFISPAIDPYNQKTLHYEITDKGFAISSVGQLLNGQGDDVPQWKYESE